MASERGWYWFAAGVLALGLTHGFSAQPAGLMQQVEENVSQAALHLSGRLMSRIEASGLVCRRQSVDVPRADVLTAQIDSRISSRLARAQAQMARERASLAVLRARQIQIAVSQEAPPVVVCPRVNVRVPRVVVSDGGTI